MSMLTPISIILNTVASILAIWVGWNMLVMIVCSGSKWYENTSIIVGTLFLIWRIWIN